MRCAALAALGALVALMATTAALAQHAGDPARQDPGEQAPAGTASPASLAGALEAAEAVIRAHAGGDYMAPDYPIVGARIDGEGGRLVVVLHEMARLAGITYGEREIQGALGTDVGIDITHDAFYPGMQAPGGPRGSLLTQDTRYYLDNCLPAPLPGYRAVCVAYAAYLGERGTVSMPPPLPPVPWPYDRPVRDRVLFFEGFERGLSANWILEGGRGWDTGHPNDGPGSPYLPASSLVAEAGPCEAECAITMRVPVDLPGGSSPELEFWSYVDSSLRPGEYMRAQLHSGGEWSTIHERGTGNADNDWWSGAFIDLSHMKGGEIRLRFVARVAGPAGSIAIDDVEIRARGDSLGDHLPVPGDPPLEKFRPDVLTGGELRRLAGDLAAMHQMAAESDALGSRLPPDIRAAAGGAAGSASVAAPGDYAPFEGGLVPEALGPAELGRIAADLASLYRIALKHDAMRSHLPQGVQEAMGLGPFEYAHANCYLWDCPVDWPVSRGWDHESYLRSEGMDVTDLCRAKHDSLLGRLGWVDAGAHWDEFLHLCGKWRDGDGVLAEFERLFEGGLRGACMAAVDAGWRLDASGALYPGWHSAFRDPVRFHDECLPRHGLGGFLADWRRAGL